MHKLLLTTQHELEAYSWAAREATVSHSQGIDRMDRDRGGLGEFREGGSTRGFGGRGGGGGGLYEDRGMDEEDHGQGIAEEKQSSPLQVHIMHIIYPINTPCIIPYQYTFNCNFITQLTLYTK